MKNSEILKSPVRLLTSIEQQRFFLLTQALMKCQCPQCGVPCSQLDASAVSDIDAFNIECSDTAFRCPSCNVGLVRVILFMVFGVRKWTWFLRTDQPRE